MLLARVLGPNGRGLLLALTFWPTLLSAILNLSLNEAAAYHVAQHAGEPEEPFRTSAAFILVVAAIVCSLTLAIPALTLIVPSHYHQHVGLMMLYATAFIPVVYMELYFRAILQGRGAINSLNAARLIQPVSYLVILLGLLGFGLLNVPTTMTATIAAMTVSLVVATALARPALLRFKAGLLREIASTGWKFHKANLLLYAASELDKAIVLVLLTTTEAGLFAVAVAISAVGTGVVLQSLGLTWMRDLATADGHAGRRRVFVVNMRAAFAVLLVVNGIAAALAPWAIPLLYGSKFAAAVPPTILLLGMGAIKGARQMIDRALRATHHTRTGMVGEATALVGTGLLGSTGAIVGGLEGLALSVFLAQAIALLVVLRISGTQIGAAPSELWPFQKAALDDLGAFMRKPSNCSLPN
jgi:O-antigen/teichoic acid export membrane protein